jgi:hypothetical protein
MLISKGHKKVCMLSSKQLRKNMVNWRITLYIGDKKGKEKLQLGEEEQWQF